MQLHGAPSPKRTILWSVMREIANLDLGVLTREERERRTSSQTVRKYVDGSGKKRFVGTDDLSKSQKLGSNIVYEHFVMLFLNVQVLNNHASHTILISINTPGFPGHTPINLDEIYSGPMRATSSTSVRADEICASNPSSTRV